MVEHMLCKHAVTGSSPVISIKSKSEMKYQVAKDKAKRSLAQKHEIRRVALKYTIRNEDTSKQTRWRSALELCKLPRNGSKVRVRNRCILTGRAKGVHREFRISRIALRELASMGLINGVMKSSW